MAETLTSRQRWIAAGFGCCIVGLIGGWLFPDGEGERAPSGPPPTVVLLVIDTLRADHLGCYGGKSAATPNLDALAARGVRFEQACCPTPLTRPAISTMMTGRLPRSHGVRDNDGVALPESVPTLAAAFRRAGWRTGAFVSGQPVDRRSGLDRGFQHYDDRLDQGSGTGYGYGYGAGYGYGQGYGYGYGGGKGATIALRERRAEATLAAATGWLRRQKGRPVFLWIHLFDPHQPYDPPEPEATHYAQSRYAGEVAYVDRALATLFDALDSTGRGSAVIACTSDHGEGLGEHGEDTHGHFLYDTTVRVPLIVAGRGVPTGTTVPLQARHQDLAATLCALARVPPLPGDEGRDLAQLWNGPGAADAPAYIETVFDAQRFGWSPLDGLRTAQLKLIGGPAPEAYDLRVDPHETLNLAAEHPDIHARVAAVRPGTTNRVGGGNGLQSPYGQALVAPREDGAGRNPHASAHLIRIFDRAVQHAGAGKHAQALAEFRRVLSDDPENPAARIWVGHCQRHLKQYTDALREYRAVDDALPAPNIEVWRGIAVCLAKLGRRDEAEQRLRRIAGRWTRDPWPHAQLGNSRVDAGDRGGALLAYSHAAELDPNDARIQVLLALAAAETSAADVASSAGRRALQLAPGDARIRGLITEVAQLLASRTDPSGTAAAAALQAALDASNR